LDSTTRSVLQRPGNIRFPSNEPYANDFEARGGRLKRLPTGHLAFYDAQGRRFLTTDPEGNPLHECEWVRGGGTSLVRARIHLDWGQWVGVDPHGMVHTTVLDLSRKPGWQRLQPDDLRQMAAQAMHVPIEEVRFFFGDDDLVIDPSGRATIRHKKDVLHVLEEGTFDRKRFMACMGAMHWDRIDFLPVVELFQSLLPGTGSAIFELIRGLYDDQNMGTRMPLALRYRGIPTYPSEAAFRLFSAFFTPHLPGGGDPFPVFMDVARSHEVTWLPAPDPPRRYFDREQQLSLTITGDRLQKVTIANDPSGLPFVQPRGSHLTPGDRSASISRGRLVLRDGKESRDIPINPAWGALRETEAGTAAPVGWRTVFGDTLPTVQPSEAFSAVLLYPEDETEIEEVATQPFVADHLQDIREQQPALAAAVARATQVLIDNGDAVIATCVLSDRPCNFTILYERPALAQKQAQVIWNQLASTGRLEFLKGIRFLAGEPHRKAVYGQRYDLIYLWLPFPHFTQPKVLEERIGWTAAALNPGGTAFIVGPELFSQAHPKHGLHIVRMEAVESLPPFRAHQNVLPRARVRAGVTLFHLRKR
jgi:hypothetical protein